MRHTYRDRGSYVVTATLTLPARYRVNGGAWRGLPAIVRTSSLPYAVDEVQAARDR